MVVKMPCEHDFEIIVEYQGFSVGQCIKCGKYNLTEGDSEEIYDNPQAHCYTAREKQVGYLVAILSYLNKNAPAPKNAYFSNNVANKMWWSFRIQHKKETDREYLLLYFRDFKGEKREKRKTDFTTRSFGNTKRYPNLEGFLENVGLYHAWGMIYRKVRSIAKAVGEEC